MRKFFSPLFFLFSLISASSQETFIKTNIDLSKKARTFPAPIISDNSLFFTIADTKKLNRFRINLADNQIIAFSESSEQSSNLYGEGCFHLRTLESNGNYTTAVYNSIKEKLYFENINFLNNKSSISDEIPIAASDMLGATIWKDKFVVMVADKKKKGLKFYFREQNGKLSSKNLELSSVEIDNRKTNLNNVINSSCLVDELTEKDPSVISSSVKVFIEDNRIILTLDVLDYYTQVIFWDINTGQTTYKKFQQEPLPGNKALKYLPRSNSYYSGNTLLYGYVYPNKLSLTFVDLSGDKIIQQITAEEGGISPFKNTVITKAETGYYYKGNEVITMDIPNLLKRLKKGVFFLQFAKSADSVAELTVGSNRKLVPYGNNYDYESLTENNQMNLGGIMIQPLQIDKSIITDLPGFRNQWINTSYFKGILQGRNLEYVSGKAVISAAESREKFMASLGGNLIIKATASLRTRTNEYFAYYDYIKKEFLIFKFEDSKN